MLLHSINGDRNSNNFLKSNFTSRILNIIYAAKEFLLKDVKGGMHNYVHIR